MKTMEQVSDDHGRGCRDGELRCLRAEGCLEGQGFLFSRPRPNADIVKPLQARCDVDSTGSADAEATMFA